MTISIDFQTLWDHFKVDAFDVLTWLKSALIGVVKADVAVLAPIFEKITVDAGAVVAADAASGDLTNLTAQFTQILTAGAQQARDAAITTSMSSLITAAHGAFANALAGQAPSAPTPPSA